MDPIKEKELPQMRFQFFSLKFTALKGISKTSTDILFDTLTYISQLNQKGQGFLVDRHKDRKGEGSRELFISSIVFMHKEKRIRCSIAMLRNDRTPMLKPKEEFKLVPLNTAELGQIAEQTHFFIDYNKSYGVVCTEFNFHGPRMLDIEFYLRQVANTQLHIAKATQVEAFMDVPIAKTLADLKNVLNFELKLLPQKLAKMDTDLVGSYFSELNAFGRKLKPKFIKLEALYQTPGNKIASKEINREATKMVKDILNRFTVRPENIDCFEGFVVKYEDNDGNDGIFDLLKGKKEIVKEVEPDKLRSARKVYELIEQDLDEFMQTLH